MYQQTYYVDKRAGTYADVFLAYGLATLLDSILSNFVDDHWVRIGDVGPYYAVELSEPLREEWVEKAPFQALVSYLKNDATDHQVTQTIPSNRIVDYEVERDRAQRHWQAVKQKAPAETLAQQKPHPDFQIWDWIRSEGMDYLRKGKCVRSTYNELVWLWQKVVVCFLESLQHVLRMFATPYQDVAQVEKEWERAVKRKAGKVETKATAIQLLNPSQGKGQNEPKANRLKMDNVDSFWLLEYLKALGMYHCAVPRRVQGTNDRKTYALAPVNMRLGANDKVLEKFQEALRNDTAVKMDILAALRYTKCFLEYCEQAKEADLMAELLGQGPEDFVAGMYVAYYKNLGQASAVMNLSFIELPRWMRVESPDDVSTYKEVIEEHENIIRNIYEERGGYDLLVYYRDFLSGGKWEAFFDFTAAYGPFLMRELDREPYRVKPFTTKNLEVLIMKSNEPLAPILETPGFRNIAEAIRRSTIIPQYRGRGESEYDIRYGVGQELKRKALYNDEFIAALSELMQSYNAENARVYEKTGKQYRKNILTTDVEDVVRLVDRYGATTVGNLLIAFGYAREPREEEETVNE